MDNIDDAYYILFRSRLNNYYWSLLFVLSLFFDEAHHITALLNHL